MAISQDGPSSPLFVPLILKDNTPLARLADIGISPEMSSSLEYMPSGACVGWGIPFEIGDVVAITGQPVTVELNPTTAQWLVFMHTSDLRPTKPEPGRFVSPMRGEGQLAEHAADYVMLYADGTEERVPIRRRHQIGALLNRMAGLGHGGSTGCGRGRILIPTSP